MTIRTISYGGGVQSTAMVVLAATRDPGFEEVMGGPVDAALFANVGDDSEHPGSLEFVREHAIPWAAERGLAIHELHRVNREGERETLWQRVFRDDYKTIAIPARGGNGAPLGRDCTNHFKVAVVAKWHRQNGATRDNPARVAIGISVDEMERASGAKKGRPHEERVYPLLELGFTRSDCHDIIRGSGLPTPRKSSCYFCPFHRPTTWSEMRRDEPTLFWQSVALETKVNYKQALRERDPLYLTRFMRPLDEAIGEAQDQLPGFESIGEGGCDEGYCFT